MGKIIFIKEIVLSPKELKICPSCEKSDHIEKDRIREDRLDGKTFHCTKCETLTIFTNYNLKKVELSSTKDDIIMLKEPYLIRKVVL